MDAESRLRRHSTSKMWTKLSATRRNSTLDNSYLLTQMIESARIAIALLMELLPKTLGPFKVISAMLDTVTVDEDGIYNTFSIDRVTFAP